MSDKLIAENVVDPRAVTAAIERFTRKHDKGVFGPNQKKYQELIPKKTPGKGEQYAFEVDLDKCTGCKACVTACYSENGLDEDETWRSVGLVRGGTGAGSAMQHITTACHHCAEPACMNGCPTLAYTKDKETGIVKHLDDQCFGCQYCILKCPYDVPKYNKKRGIVHKCDMCIGRLNDGQPPACVRACPNGAIRITVVDNGDVKENSEDYVRVPDAPASNYTYPTTKYKTNRIFPTNMESVDYYTVEPEHSHLPLVFMLVLTQLSVGAFSADFFGKPFMNPHFSAVFLRFHIPIALGLGLLALASSILHLGRPHLAFRAILGFKTSWLSREIILFGLFAKLAILYALCAMFQPVEQLLRTWTFGLDPARILSLIVVISGIMGILCSAMVYRDTKRPFWNNAMTTVKFVLTAVILGMATNFLTATMISMLNSGIPTGYVNQSLGHLSCRIIWVTVLIKCLVEAGIFLIPNRSGLTFIKKTAILMGGRLRQATLWRFGCGVTGGVVLPLIFIRLCQDLGATSAFVLALLIWGLCLAGEILERYLFFRAVVPLKMP
ncbi:MAG: dimethyl sulfoxide reductase anchor subunit [Candidatus Omnitrophica bacterium]|nr:dimethyl sulfoxide reductase anchor subunit [Candidatus Omnitrophota bacterium]